MVWRGVAQFSFDVLLGAILNQDHPVLCMRGSRDWLWDWLDQSVSLSGLTIS